MTSSITSAILSRSHPTARVIQACLCNIGAEEWWIMVDLRYDILWY
jgi:hypothetical protein